MEAGVVKKYGFSVEFTVKGPRENIEMFQDEVQEALDAVCSEYCDRVALITVAITKLQEKPLEGR